MRYFLGPAQDTRYQPLSDIFILASLSYLARSDLVDCNDYSSRETHEEMVITVLLVVPDLHTFIRKLLLTSTEPMLNYYRTKSERESGCTGYELMFDQIFTKLLEHREGLDTGDGRSKDHEVSEDFKVLPLMYIQSYFIRFQMFHSQRPQKVLLQASAKTQFINKLLNELVADPQVQTVTKTITVRQLLPFMAEQCDLLGRKAKAKAVGMLDLDNISAFILNCYSYGLARETYGFLQSVIQELDAIKDTEYDEVVIPFLCNIATAWITSAVLERPTYRRLLKHVLYSYLIKFVKSEPEVPEISRAPVACSCASPCKHCNNYEDRKYEERRKLAHA
ncbi:hypothetical protein PTMSG1_06660 [Pyrenophora teres f. maculata]|nr:hypothetical protein PTMSG1_06660 [Pyrenophora teres f. maculata]